MNLDQESLDLLGISSVDELVAPMPDEAALVGGAFDAAKRNERTLALWQPTLQSADMDIVPEKYRLDARSRDSVRNDAYVRGGQVATQDNIVGSLYALNAKPMARLLGESFDDDWQTEFQEEAEMRFTLWAESLDNWVDASRTNNFTEMVRLAVGVHTAGGEVLASAEWMRGRMRPFQTAIQFIDTDRLCNPPTELHNWKLVAGVEKDRFGAAQAYHIRVAHPSDWRSLDNHRWKRIPARKPWGRTQIIHIFEQNRPDQTRGIAAMVAALKEIRMTKQFRDVVLQNAVVNATYAASIESELPSSEVFATLGGTDNPGEALGQYATQYLTQIADYSGGAKNLQLDGVRIPHLYPGTKLNLQPVGKGGPLGENFEQSLLRYVAAGLGISYEQLSKDYSRTNYSSARAAMAETWKRMNVTKRLVADRFASHVYRLWLEEALNKGMIESVPNVAKREGWLYEGQNLDAICQADWIGASKGQIEELRETQAAILRMKSGLTTLEQEAARLGLDWRTSLRQQKREAELRKELQLSHAMDTKTESVEGDDGADGSETKDKDDD